MYCTVYYTVPEDAPFSKVLGDTPNEIAILKSAILCHHCHRHRRNNKAAIKEQRRSAIHARRGKRVETGRREEGYRHQWPHVRVGISSHHAIISCTRTSICTYNTSYMVIVLVIILVIILVIVIVIVVIVIILVIVIVVIVIVVVIVIILVIVIVIVVIVIILVKVVVIVIVVIIVIVVVIVKVIVLVIVIVKHTTPRDGCPRSIFFPTHRSIDSSE